MADNKFYAIVGVLTAIVISISLYLIHSLYAGMNGGNEEYAIESCADIYKRSIEFNGMRVNPDLTLREYNRKGRLVREDVKLRELLTGNGCIIILSDNNCVGCVRNEIALLRKLENPEKMLFIYDTPHDEHSERDEMPIHFFYEVEAGEVLPGFERMQEMPVLFYVEDGSVTASCVVSNYTRPMTTEFHNFLKKRLLSDVPNH